MKRPDEKQLAQQRSGPRERVRQKFLENGINAFQAYEVLEYMLFMLIPQRDVKPIAKALIERFKNVSGVFGASHQELVDFGLTSRIAADILFLKEMMQFWQQEKLHTLPALQSTKDTVLYLQAKIGSNPKETLVVFYLNSIKKVVGVWEVEGTVNNAAVPIREISERALLYHATAVILAHNHPSGSCRPSQADVDFTKSVYNALDLFDITLLDHLIITKNAHFSLLM